VPDLVLIHPPVAIPSEPPVGLATLAGRLRRAGVEVQVVDANVEALEQLLDRSVGLDPRSPAESRAQQHRQRALDQLRSAVGYENLDRHRTAVGDLRRLLALASAPSTRVDLAAYDDPSLSPLKRADLLSAAREREQSPFWGYFEALARRVASTRPRAVGLSVNYLHQALPAMALAGALRHQLGADVPILCGGALFSCWRGRLHEGALDPWVDRVIFGGGVAALLQLLDLPQERPGANHAPDYSGLPWSTYLAPAPIVPATTSMGCHWARCRYCPEATTQMGHRADTLGDDLCAVLSRLCREAGAGLLHITDSAIPPENLQLLAGGGALPAPWYGFVRFSPQLADDDLCLRLRASGCTMLQLGLESGSRQVLSRLRKGINLAQASACLEALHAAGIRIYLYVMFGTPGEDEADARKTLSFIEAHARLISCLNVSLLNMPLASPAEPGLVTQAFPGAGDLSLYCDFATDPPTRWDRRAARHFMERELAKSAVVGPILRRTPLVFGANHAPLLGLSG
jgi:Radical SAM superfamily